jgi:hypothetical protein
MFPSTPILIDVVLRFGTHERVRVAAPPNATVLDLVTDAFSQLDLTFSPDQYTVTLGDQDIAWTYRLPTPEDPSYRPVLVVSPVHFIAPAPPREECIDLAEADCIPAGEFPSRVQAQLDMSDILYNLPTVVMRESQPVPAAPPEPTRPPPERHATVRCYKRMNPDRSFPLTVFITRKEVGSPKDDAVGQAKGTFQAHANTVVEVEPILVGCDVYPPCTLVRIGAADTSTTFHPIASPPRVEERRRARTERRDQLAGGRYTQRYPWSWTATLDRCRR